MLQERDDLRRVPEVVDHDLGQLVGEPVEIEKEIAPQVLQVRPAREIRIAFARPHAEHPPRIVKQDGYRAESQKPRPRGRHAVHAHPFLHHDLKADGAVEPDHKLHRQVPDRTRSSILLAESLQKGQPVPRQDRPDAPVAHRRGVAADQQPNGARQQIVGHRGRVVEVKRTVPALKVAQGAELGMAPQIRRQAAVSGVVVPEPASKVSPGRSVALYPPRDLQARPVGRGETAQTALAPEFQPVRGIEEPACEAGAGLWDVQAERRPGQGGGPSKLVPQGVRGLDPRLPCRAWRRPCPSHLSHLP